MADDESAAFGTVKRLRRLTDTELETYDLIPVEISRRVWLLQVPILPGPYNGLTLSRFVVVDEIIDPAESSILLAHELVHVRQYHELGLPRFAWRYNVAFVRGLVRLRNWNKAYRAIPAEVEARQQAGLWAKPQPDQAGL